jgi:abortive infection bacteriophage resistance protein
MMVYSLFVNYVYLEYIYINYINGKKKREKGRNNWREAYILHTKIIGRRRTYCIPMYVRELGGTHSIWFILESILSNGV